MYALQNKMQETINYCIQWTKFLYFAKDPHVFGAKGIQLMNNVISHPFLFYLTFFFNLPAVFSRPGPGGYMSDPMTFVALGTAHVTLLRPFVSVPSGTSRVP